MEQFWQSVIGTLIGTGMGGIIVYLAFQKVVEKIIEQKIQPIWDKIDGFKKDYQSKELCKVMHEHAEKDNKRIEEALQRIERLIISQQKP